MCKTLRQKLTLAAVRRDFFIHRLHLKKIAQKTITVINLKECTQTLLPKGESLQKAEKLEGGFSNDLWRVHTENRSYILRTQKEKNDPTHFQQMLAISKRAWVIGIGPRVVSENLPKQQMLLENIPHEPWPSPTTNIEPYIETMQALHCFHKELRADCIHKKEMSFTPFNLISKLTEKLKDNPRMPEHFEVALKKTHLILAALKPWLKAHATICHGDFHKGNVLLSRIRHNIRPVLIDFDSFSIGHPLFDVVKFSIALPPKIRHELFCAYLGASNPNPEEQAHFDLIDLALLMVITTVRFNSAQNIQAAPQECLSKIEMEEMLNSPKPLPSFLSMSFADTSPKAERQHRDLCPQ